MQVKDKVVIVTGAGSGIGEATAKLFTQHQAKVVVSDIMGRSIISKSVEILRGVNEQNLNINNLPNGIYFVQLRSQNRILFTEKVIKE